MEKISAARSHKSELALPLPSITGAATSTAVGFSIEGAVAASGIGRTLLFRAIQQGKLKARKYGRRTIVLPEDLAEFLKNLPVKEVA